MRYLNNGQEASPTELVNIIVELCDLTGHRLPDATTAVNVRDRAGVILDQLRRSKADEEQMASMLNGDGVSPEQQYALRLERGRRGRKLMSGGGRKTVSTGKRPTDERCREVAEKW